MNTSVIQVTYCKFDITQSPQYTSFRIVKHGETTTSHWEGAAGKQATWFLTCPPPPPTFVHAVTLLLIISLAPHTLPTFILSFTLLLFYPPPSLWVSLFLSVSLPNYSRFSFFFLALPREWKSFGEMKYLSQGMYSTIRNHRAKLIQTVTIVTIQFVASVHLVMSCHQTFCEKKHCKKCRGGPFLGIRVILGILLDYSKGLCSWCTKNKPKTFMSQFQHMKS